MPKYDEILEMFSYMRPHESDHERRFINRFIMPLGMRTDPFGNLHKRIGDAPVLWSCHTDTVHYHSGRQRIRVENGIMSLKGASKAKALTGLLPNCLGGDDTAGVWIMMEMIRHKVPGLYVFHRGEEIGGIGSIAIASRNPKFLDGISYAIAFDRRGHDNIITHQGGGRTCSDAFGLSFAADLNFGYKNDPTGLFTDTANYADLIPECSNISVGYSFAHGWKETQDVAHLISLRDKVCSLRAVGNWMIARDPCVVDGKQWWEHYDDDNLDVVRSTIPEKTDGYTKITNAELKRLLEAKFGWTSSKKRKLYYDDGSQDWDGRTHELTGHTMPKRFYDLMEDDDA